MGDLCTECALCCDGTMFDSVELSSADDVEPLSTLPAVFTERAGSVRIQQPCPALVGKCCSVYERRPSACRAFECDVLLAYEGGTLTLNDAQALTARAVRLSAAVRPQLEVLLEPALGLQELARRAGFTGELGRATVLYRPAFPKVLADVQARLRQMPDTAAAVATHQALLDDAGELYELLVDSFGLGRD